MVSATTTQIPGGAICHYKHLRLIEREKILLFYDEGKSVTAIAELLGRSKSTISRELRRTASDDEYIPAITYTLNRS